MGFRYPVALDLEGRRCVVVGGGTVAEHKVQGLLDAGAAVTVVAEEFTGTPGAYVPIAETIRGFQEIIEGKHDEVPESAFFLKGTIDEVVEAAKK